MHSSSFSSAIHALYAARSLSSLPARRCPQTTFCPHTGRNCSIGSQMLCRSRLSPGSSGYNGTPSPDTRHPRLFHSCTGPGTDALSVQKFLLKYQEYLTPNFFYQHRDLVSRIIQQQMRMILHQAISTDNHLQLPTVYIVESTKD